MIDNLQALRARDDLLAVAASWSALQARLRPAGSSGDGVRTAPTSRPPIDLGVSDLLAEIEEHARFLGKVLLDEVTPEHGCDGACHGTAEHRCDGRLCATEGEPLVAAQDCPTRRDPVTTSAMPGLLEDVARRYGHFTAADDRTALDFCDEAHELRRKVSGVITSREPARWVGPCPVNECDGELRQRRRPVHGVMVTEHATCQACGSTVGPVEWRAMMYEAFEKRLMTRSELVSALVVVRRPVKPNTLNHWVQRGRIVAVMSDPELFRFADGYELAEKFDQTKDEERMSA